MTSAVAERTAYPERQPSWFQPALEEYRGLREEVVATLQTQQMTLTFGTSALAVLALAVFTAWNDAPLAAGATLLVGFPILSGLLLIIWMGELTRMMRVGDYLAQLEGQIKNALPDAPQVVFSWEMSLRQRYRPGAQRHYEWNYWATVCMFCLFSLGAASMGLYRILSIEKPPNVIWPICGVFFDVILSVWIGSFLVRQIRKFSRHKRGTLRSRLGNVAVSLRHRAFLSRGPTNVESTPIKTPWRCRISSFTEDLKGHFGTVCHDGPYAIQVDYYAEASPDIVIRKQLHISTAAPWEVVLEQIRAEGADVRDAYDNAREVQSRLDRTYSLDP